MATGTLGALIVSLGLDATEYVSGLTKSEYQAKQAMDRIKTQTDSATAAWRRFGAVVGGGISVAGVIAFVKQTVSATAALDDMAERTGASVEKLSGLVNVALVGGHSLETLEAGLIKTAKALGGTDEKAKEATAALAAIGLDRNKLRELDPADAFVVIAKRLDEYGDGLGKTSLALALWGKSGAANLPILKDLAEQQETLRKRTTEEAAAAEQLEKNFKRLGLETTELKKAFVVDAIPALNEWVGAVREAYKEGGALMALWVGLGGVAANVLGATDRQKTAARLKEIDEQLGRARAQLKAGRLNPEGASDNFFSFLIPNIKLGDDAVMKLSGTIDRLEEEKKRINDSLKPPPKEIKPQVPFRVSDEDKAVQKRIEDIKRMHEEVANLGRSIDVNILPLTGSDLAADNLDKTKRRLDATKKTLEEGKKDWIAYADAVFSAADAENTAAAAGESFTEHAEKTREKLLDLIDPLRAIKREHQEIDVLVATGWLTEMEGRLGKLPQSVRELILPVKNIHEEIQKAWEAGLLTTDQMEQALKRVQTPLEKTDSLAHDLGLTFSSAFEDAITGGKKFSEILKGLEKDIIRIVTRKLVTEPLGNSITGAINGSGGGGGLIGWIAGLFSGGAGSGAGAATGSAAAQLAAQMTAANGAVFDQLGVSKFANGGIVTRPTPFRFARGGAMLPGLMGEAGPEAIVPLRRGLDGKLGIAMSGSRGASMRESIVIHNNFTINGPTDRRSQSQIAAHVGETVRRAVSRDR